jgi:hypothetical protein
MKKLFLLTLSLIALTIMSFKKETHQKITRSLNSKSTIIETVNTFGVDKGQRKNCAPLGATIKTCCDRKFCLVSNVETNNTDIMVSNYFETTIEVINDTVLVFNIAQNKIHSSAFQYWLINNTYEGEYFPLDNSVSSKFGKSDIALSAGNYPVVTTPTGFKIEINYKTITGE